MWSVVCSVPLVWSFVFRRTKHMIFVDVTSYCASYTTPAARGDQSVWANLTVVMNSINNMDKVRHKVTETVLKLFVCLPDVYNLPAGVNEAHLF